MKMKEEMEDFFTAIDEDQEYDVKYKNTVFNRRRLIEREIQLFRNNNDIRHVDINNGLPPTLPKKVALLYQT